MSLTGWISWDSGLIDNLVKVTGCATDKWWVPTVPQSALKAPPITNHYAEVGMAFDYAMRLRLVQLCGLSPLMLSSSHPHYIVAERGICGTPRRARFIADFWRRWIDGHATLPVTEFLSDCFVLAHLECVFRTGIDDGNDAIFAVDPADIDDLRGLVGLLDNNQSLWSGRDCVLNPHFGDSSAYIGGADADLVLHCTLIDIKTTKYLTLTKEYLRQLMGYYILNLRENDMYRIQALGVYFSRHGVLFTFPLPKSSWSGEQLCRDDKDRVQPVGWQCMPIWDDIENSMSKFRRLMV